MKFIAILVEGQTEEKFVEEILNPYLIKSNIIAKPILTKTSSGHKGGFPKYQRVRKDICILLNQVPRVYSLVTTMFDYYKLPHDFPGKHNLPKGDSYIKVKHIEKSMFEDIKSTINSLDENPCYFIPYIQLHEFESLLFASIEGFESWRAKSSKFFQNILQKYSYNPELINDLNPPSKRIIQIFRDKLGITYVKRSDGIEIAKAVGINRMIEQCRHFREWLKNIIKCCS